MAKSTKSQSAGKPQKPYEGFPLFAHATKRWAKKIRGKLHYFGPWSDPDGALEKYLAQRDDLHAGRVPRTTGDGLTIRDLCNTFLTAKRDLVTTGEITPKTFRDYFATCERLVTVFGRGRMVQDLRAEDFGRLRAELAKRRGPVALASEIGRVRVAFNYAYQAELIDKPVRFGPTFRKPSRRILRQARQAKGPRMFEAAELRRIIDAARPPLKAMVLLGINCGFGQTDIATLPVAALDLAAGWVDYPRPKTAIPRRCPLWPETVAALQEALSRRPGPKDEADAGLAFLTKYGNRWVRTKKSDKALREKKQERTISLDALSHQFDKLAAEAGVERRGRGFYCLRRGFETVAGRTLDQPSVDYIMGHAPAANDMAAVYRQSVDDDRLQAVVDHVRGWLFQPDDEDSPATVPFRARHG